MSLFRPHDPAHDLPDGKLRRFELWLHRNRVRLLTIAVVLMFVTSLATAYLGFRAQQQRDKDFQEFLAVGTARRDQSCRADEREHKRNVDNLRRTYRALNSPTTRADLGPGLVKLIVAQMPQAEDLARNDQAPEYCDEPGVKAERLYRETNGKQGLPPVGLPEPDPVPPKRQDFNYLLAPSNTPP